MAVIFRLVIKITFWVFTDFALSIIHTRMKYVFSFAKISTLAKSGALSVRLVTSP